MMQGAYSLGLRTCLKQKLDKDGIDYFYQSKLNIK